MTLINRRAPRVNVWFFLLMKQSCLCIWTVGGYVINPSHSLMPAAYVQYSYLSLFWNAANLLVCHVRSMTRGHFTVKCPYFLILLELCCVWFMQVQGLHVWSHVSALHKLPSVQEAHQHRQGNSTPVKLNNPFEFTWKQIILWRI